MHEYLQSHNSSRSDGSRSDPSTCVADALRIFGAIAPHSKMILNPIRAKYFSEIATDPLAGSGWAFIYTRVKSYIRSWLMQVQAVAWWSKSLACK